jgi:predicted XRE-type DNA-binding protein
MPIIIAYKGIFKAFGDARNFDATTTHIGASAEEAPNLRIQADLMIQLRKLIKARGLTQAEAAKLLGVLQPRVSDLMRGKIDVFSIDTPVNMVTHARGDVSLVVKPQSKVA